MMYRIVLFDKSRVQVGNIQFEPATRELSMDWNQNYPEELFADISTLLEKVYKDAQIETMCEIKIDKGDGKIVRAEKFEKVPLDDEKFLAALTDRINRTASGKQRIFAVLQKN